MHDPSCAKHADKETKNHRISGGNNLYFTLAGAAIQVDRRTNTTFEAYRVDIQA
jgi:hypothetical protein